MTIMERAGVVALVAFCAMLLLRLLHIFNISWIAVTAPLWIYGAICVIVIVLFFALGIEKKGHSE